MCIQLTEEKDLYLLEDLQGGTFGGGRIFEGIDEVAKAFITWADSDELEVSDGQEMPADIRTCLDIWEMNLYRYTGTKFELLDYNNGKKEFDYLK